MKNVVIIMRIILFSLVFLFLSVPSVLSQQWHQTFKRMNPGYDRVEYGEFLYYFFKPEEIKQIRVRKTDLDLYNNFDLQLEIIFKEKIKKKFFSDHEHGFGLRVENKNTAEMLNAYQHLSQLAEMIKNGQITGFVHLERGSSLNPPEDFQAKVDEFRNLRPCVYLFQIIGFYYMPYSSPSVPGVQDFQTMDKGKNPGTLQYGRQPADQPVISDDQDTHGEPDMEGEPPQDDSPDIGGPWKSSTDRVFQIDQQGRRFTWYVRQIRERGAGKIEGDRISVNWPGVWNRTVHGVIREFDPDGRPMIIEWDNDVVFHRE